MTLRIRLNILVTGIFVTMVALGAALVIYNARSAVEEETRSTATFAFELLAFTFEQTDAARGGVDHDRLLSAIEGLEAARHMSISVANGGLEPEPGNASDGRPVDAPAWFVAWVRPDVSAFRRTLAGSDAAGPAIVITADPSDEIEESWDDAKTLLGLVTLFAIVANGLLFVVIGRWLRPLRAIGSAMDEVQQGNYRRRLPAFGLPELSTVAEQFNRMTEVLERSREDNRLLAQKTLAIQEQERRKLAHELHDELGQSISAIRALAVSINQGSTREVPVRSAAATIADVAGHVYTVVRGMMIRLRPVLLDEFGLVPALESLVDSWNSRAVDGFCRFTAAGEFDDLDDACRIGLYRIVQEALTNVTKHADATEIDVSLTRHGAQAGETLALVVADNGRGFDSAAARSGLGLLGMRERVESLDGRLDIRSAPGSGTSVLVTIPAAAARAAA